MATRRPRQNGWHRVKGRWSRSIGERGTRIRLFQKRIDGVFYRDVWVAGKGKHRLCMGTADRNDAENLGRQLLAALLSDDLSQVAGPLKLGDLWDRFNKEASAHLDNCVTTRADADARADTLVGFFGRDCDVRNLTENDQEAYTRQRLAGGIVCGNDRVTGPVRARSVEADLKLLHAMLKWATTVRVRGGRLLDHHPLAGIWRIREQNPQRSMATYRRFASTRKAMQTLASDAESDAEKMRWLKVELMLVLAEATGRRLNSIRHLRWEDVNFAVKEIHWRAEFDKKRKEWVVPVPDALLDELRQFRCELGAVAGWVFAAERDMEKPMDRHLFDKWLRQAELKAELPKLPRALWHAYRRKWATERKHLPAKDVAAVGGWSDIGTLITCYQQPDRDTMLAVMSEQRKVVEVAAGA